MDAIAKIVLLQPAGGVYEVEPRVTVSDDRLHGRAFRLFVGPAKGSERNNQHVRKLLADRLHKVLIALEIDLTHDLAGLQLKELHDLLLDGSRLSLARLEAMTETMVSQRQTFSPLAQTVIDAELFLLSAVKAALTFDQPSGPLFMFPRPSFNVFRSRAVYDLLRPIFNVLIVFAIWDATAWSNGPTLLTYVGVFTIALLPFEDPALALQGVFVGALLGIAAGLIALYLIFPMADGFAWLGLVMGAMVALFGIGQTFPKLAGIALGFANLVLIVTSPTNPQQYDLAASLNSAFATLLGLVIVAISFELFGAPRRGMDRVAQGQPV